MKYYIAIYKYRLKNKKVDFDFTIFRSDGDRFSKEFRDDVEWNIIFSHTTMADVKILSFIEISEEEFLSIEEEIIKDELHYNHFNEILFFKAKHKQSKHEKQTKRALQHT